MNQIMKSDAFLTSGKKPPQCEFGAASFYTNSRERGGVSSVIDKPPLRVLILRQCR